jgi:hypothetical protein
MLDVTNKHITTANHIRLKRCQCLADIHVVTTLNAFVQDADVCA